MANDLKRVEVDEELYTFRGDRGNKLALELDRRLTGRDLYMVIARSGGLISTIIYYRDPGHTDKDIERIFGRTGGVVDSITTIFYNKDGSEDSRVVTSITLDGSNCITECNSTFSTGESPC